MCSSNFPGYENELKRARECYGRRAWSEAHQLLSLADQESPLAAEDLELLATSAYLIGRNDDFHRFLERAHHTRLQQGDELRAARCAFWLGLMLLLRGETAQANGWLSRAQRLVEGRDCVEHGYLLLPVAELRLGERDSDAALSAAADAAEIGERFGDADVTACARHLQGRALIEQGQVQQGLGLLDEVMIAVSTGELSPILTGLLYCSVIDACQQVFALSRAREWTFAFTRWCAQQSEMVAFTGICLVHRAEVMQFRGTWAEAMAEACHAYERFSEAGEREASAAAFYRQGEIHRLRGEFAAAEKKYRDASRFGFGTTTGICFAVDGPGTERRRLRGDPPRPERGHRSPPSGEIASRVCRNFIGRRRYSGSTLCFRRIGRDCATIHYECAPSDGGPRARRSRIGRRAPSSGVERPASRVRALARERGPV